MIWFFFKTILSGNDLEMQTDLCSGLQPLVGFRYPLMSWMDTGLSCLTACILP